jgi:hypothetical protein
MHECEWLLGSRRPGRPTDCDVIGVALDGVFLLICGNRWWKMAKRSEPGRGLEPTGTVEPLSISCYHFASLDSI